MRIRFGKLTTAIGAGAIAAMALVPAMGIGPLGAATPPSAANCALSGLVVWMNTEGNGAAGSSYYQLEFTNLSGHTCSITGYARVFGVTLQGAQLGSAASRNAVHSARAVTLANGEGATATLQIVEAGNYPTATCKQVMAAGLRVFLPSTSTRLGTSGASKTIPFPFEACSRPGPVYLSVEPVARA